MREVFDYEAAPKEDGGETCTACADPRLICAAFDVDRYGYSVCRRACSSCGHVWLAERMTPAAYADFYASGAYRRLVSAFHGREINGEALIKEQVVYAQRLERAFQVPMGATVLDVGGGNGTVSKWLSCAKSQANPTILDPSGEPAPGCEVIHGMAEDLPAGRTWDLILLCQTIDHLLDPAAVLTKLRAALAPGGVMWVDALDYDITRELKIDHPHNFTAKSLGRILDRTGWQTLSCSRWNRHVGFVCA